MKNKRPEKFLPNIDKKKCFECSSPAKEMHHPIPVILGGTRVIPLCEKCHGKAHGLNREGHGFLIKKALSKLKKNRKVYGKVPYGFRAVNGKLVPFKKEMLIIKTIRKWKSEGMSLRKIQILATKKKLLSRANTPLSLPAIHKILKGR